MPEITIQYGDAKFVINGTGNLTFNESSINNNEEVKSVDSRKIYDSNQMSHIINSLAVEAKKRYIIPSKIIAGIAAYSRIQNELNGHDLSGKAIIAADIFNSVEGPLKIVKDESIDITVIAVV